MNDLQSIRDYIKKLKIDDHKIPWLIESINKYINVDFHNMSPSSYYSVTDRNETKIETVKSMIQLASLINIEGMKVVNIDAPYFHYKFPIEEKINQSFENDFLLNVPDYSNYCKTFTIETYSTSCCYDPYQHIKKIDHGSIIEIHNNKIYKDILIKEMAQILNKKLLNASIFFIMQLGHIIEIQNPNSMNRPFGGHNVKFETRVCFHY